MHCRFAAVVVLALTTACAPPPPPTEAGLRELTAPPPAQGQCKTPGVHVEVVNRGNESLEVFWVSATQPPISFRIGEAGLGTSYLRVADHIREQIFSKRGHFNVRDASRRNYAEANRRLNYRLRLRCTEDIDPTKR